MKYDVTILGQFKEERTIEATNATEAKDIAITQLEDIFKGYPKLVYKINETCVEPISVKNEIMPQIREFHQLLANYLKDAVITETFVNNYNQKIEYIYLDCNEKYVNDANFCCLRIDGKLYFPSMYNGAGYPANLEESRMYLWYEVGTSNLIYLTENYYKYGRDTRYDMFCLHNRLKWLNEHYNSKGIILNAVYGKSEIEFQLHDNIVRNEEHIYTAIYDDVYAPIREEYKFNKPIKISENID